MLLAHPAVREAVAFALPDAKYGEDGRRPPSCSAATPTEEELRAHCRRRLAAFKVPTRIVASTRSRRADRQVQRRLLAERSATMRIAVVGAGAIGAYVGAALARGGADVHLVARGAHLRRSGATACGCSRRAATSRRSAGDRRPGRDRPGRRRLPRAEGLLLRRGGRRCSRRCCAPDTAVVAAQNGIPWWYFHGLGGPYDGRRSRPSIPAARRRAVDRARARDRLRRLLRRPRSRRPA